VFEHFTDQARVAVVVAQEESRRCGHPAIDTEHLLLALLHTNDTAFQLLERAGFTLEETRAEVLAPEGEGPPDHIPFSAPLKEALEMSLHEALRLQDDFIGTEHLLLGLLREGNGAAAQALQRRGFELEPTRLAIANVDRGTRRGAHEPPGKLGSFLQRTRRRFGRG
jgi:ATP-dependent Clp protease ATP-binding subunit ClpC